MPVLDTNFSISYLNESKQEFKGEEIHENVQILNNPSIEIHTWGMEVTLPYPFDRSP